LSCNLPQRLDRLQGGGEQLIGELHIHPLARLDEVDDTPVDDVAGLAKHQRLHRQLAPFGLPYPARRRRASLVVDRRDDAVMALQQVEPTDQPQLRSRDQQRPRALEVGRLGRPRRPAGLGVDDPVLVATVDRVGVVDEPRLHPFQEEQSRAVHELVDHSGRDQLWHVLPRAHLRPARAAPAAATGRPTC